MSQLKNVRSNFADNREMAKSRSSQGVEKTSAKQENGKFWGPPVKEVGT